MCNNFHWLVALVGAWPCYDVLLFRQFGLQTSQLHVSHATLTLLTFTLRTIPKVWVGSNQILFPLEAESVSTRTRTCFYSNQNLYRLDAWEHDGSRYVASLRFGGRKNMAWLRESWHIMRQGCLSSETIPSGRLTDTQIRVKPPDCYLSLFKPPLPYRYFPIKIAVIRFWGANSISWKRRHVN